MSTTPTPNPPKSRAQRCTNSATRMPRDSSSGCDIVTVQKLMGHSDIETTQQYLNPDEALKRKAVNRLSLTR